MLASILLQAAAWDWGLLLGWFFSGVYMVTIAVSVLVVIFDKRDPTKTLLWVVVLVLLPVLGLVFYLGVGQNLRRRQSSQRSSGQGGNSLLGLLGEYIVPLGRGALENPSLTENAYLAQLLQRNCHAPVLRGNAVRLFHLGGMAFGEIAEDLRRAKEYIHMEYYIFAADELGTKISELLIEKAEAGLDVRVIYDSVGSWRLTKTFIRRMNASGVKMYPFQRVTFPYLGSRMNNRNHRKILIIDGAIAYMGGMNIAEKYIKGTKQGAWIDTQMRVVGPAIGALHGIFLNDWRYVTKAARAERFALPVWDEQAGDALLQISASGPDSQWSAIMQSFFVAITKAKRYIYISTPYFVPNESLLTALKTAALSGVDVRLLLPFQSDAKLVLWATRSYILPLLEAGIRVYLFRGGFNHSKILMVDGMLSAVGSANMDIRSFEENFEVMAYIYDENLTRALELEFIENVRQSVEVSHEEWMQRPLGHRVKDSFARLLSPLF